MEQGLQVIIRYRGAKYHQVLSASSDSAAFSILKKDLLRLRVHCPAEKNVDIVGGSFVLHWPTANPRTAKPNDSLHSRWLKMCSNDPDELDFRERLSIESIVMLQDGMTFASTAGASQASENPARAQEGSMCPPRVGLSANASPLGAISGVVPSAPSDRQQPLLLKRRASDCLESPPSATRRRLDSLEAADVTLADAQPPRRPSTSLRTVREGTSFSYWASMDVPPPASSSAVREGKPLSSAYTSPMRGRGRGRPLGSPRGVRRGMSPTYAPSIGKPVPARLSNGNGAQASPPAKPLPQGPSPRAASNPLTLQANPTLPVRESGRVHPTAVPAPTPALARNPVSSPTPSTGVASPSKLPTGPALMRQKPVGVQTAAVPVPASPSLLVPASTPTLTIAAAKPPQRPSPHVASNPPKSPVKQALMGQKPAEVQTATIAAPASPSIPVPAPTPSITAAAAKPPQRPSPSVVTPPKLPTEPALMRQRPVDVHVALAAPTSPSVSVLAPAPTLTATAAKPPQRSSPRVADSPKSPAKPAGQKPVGAQAAAVPASSSALPSVPVPAPAPTLTAAPAPALVSVPTPTTQARPTPSHPTPPTPARAPGPSNLGSAPTTQPPPYATLPVPVPAPAPGPIPTAPRRSTSPNKGARQDLEVSRLTRELWDTRRQLAALQARERTRLDDLERLGARPGGAAGADRNSVLREDFSRLEAELKAEKARRVRIERTLGEVERECRTPFVVPALLRAFINISELSD